MFVLQEESPEKNEEEVQKMDEGEEEVVKESSGKSPGKRGRPKGSTGKGRGRPRKSDSEQLPVINKNKENGETNELSNEEDVVVKTKGRGRPKGTKNKSKSAEDKPDPSERRARLRGGPRLSYYEEDSSSGDEYMPNRGGAKRFKQSHRASYNSDDDLGDEEFEELIGKKKPFKCKKGI